MDQKRARAVFNCGPEGVVDYYGARRLHTRPRGWRIGWLGLSLLVMMLNFQFGWRADKREGRGSVSWRDIYVRAEALMHEDSCFLDNYFVDYFLDNIKCHYLLVEQVPNVRTYFR